MMLLSMYAVATANASTPAKVAVPQGVTLAGINAKPVFPVKASTKETVSFVLKMRHEGELEAKVDAGFHGHFLSVSQFANRYSQPASRIRALESFLRSYHLKTTAYSDGLVVTAKGTAREFNHALSVSQDEYKAKAVPARGAQAARPAFTFRATKDAPLLPATIARYVESILGLDNYPLFASNAVHTQTAEPQHGSGLNTGNRTPASFARDYGLDALYRKGADGKGQTLGIVTFASIRPADATHFWSKILKIKTKKNRIKLDNVDGGSGKVSAALGSDETTLDVEQSGGVAPQASIIVYQAPNTDYGGIDAYAAAASQNTAQTVSCSWGESETILDAYAAAGGESSTLIPANDELFLELAAQGQSSFTASDDEGAYAASADLGTTNLSVQSTPDSPWTTAAGATTLAGTIPLLSPLKKSTTYVHIKYERAWGWDWQWKYYQLFPTTQGGSTPFSSEAAFAKTDVVGSGGGYSTVELRPGYQKATRGVGDYTAVPYLTPAGYAKQLGTNVVEPTTWSVWDQVTNSPKPPATITGSANGRAVPDLSADGDPYTGYQEYFVGFPGTHIEFGWGGTSFVAPQLNGSAAVIDSYLGHRVGFWNPAIYKFAASRHSPFTPIDSTGGSNTNIYYTGTRGHIYNPGTGLGTPNLSKLAADFRSL
jgi:subtilase family serine protease